MDVKKVILYAHGGSANHGCEAIVRSTIQILIVKFNQFILLSNEPNEDKYYGINNLATLKSPFSEKQKNKLSNFLFLLKMKILKNDYYFYKEKYRKLSSKTENAEWAFSVGGDNYCYPGYEAELRAVNERLHTKKIKTILWGCSIEPKVLTDYLIKDLNKYFLIVARESITYNVLHEKGLSQTVFYSRSCVLFRKNR